MSQQGRKSKRVWIGVFIFLAGLLIFLVFRPAATVSVAATATPQSAPSTEPPAFSAAPITPPVPLNAIASNPQVWLIQDGGASGRFVPALDEFLWRDSDGAEEVISISPVRDLDAMKARITREAQTRTSGGGFPVFYEDGKPRDAASRRVVTNQVRVRWTGTGDPSVAGAVSIIRPDYAPDYVLVEMPDSFSALEVQERLRGTPGVAEADVLLAKTRFKRAMPNDPFVGRQWHLKFANQSGAISGTDMNIESAWGYGTTSPLLGSGIRIGIVDDGMETAHPDLAANVDTATDKDWNGNDADPNPGAGDDHGTACAGNAAAVGNNGIGVAGSAPGARLVGLRLIATTVTDAQEAEAMTYLMNTVSGNSLIHIKSNSWGPSDTGSVLEEPGPLTISALRTAATTGRNNLGTIIVWAAGNGGEVTDNSNYDGYANSIYTLAVGAFDSQSRRAAYSERGANLVVVAPSSGNSPSLGVTTVDRSGANGYNSGSTPGEISDANYTSDFGGTSSATPSAAGVIALILQRNPNLGWRDVQEILIRSARRVNPSEAEWATNGAGIRFNHNYGAGLIDAAAAVTLAATWSNLPVQTSRTITQSGLSVAIPNNNATGITRTFTLSGSNLRVEHVTVKVSISHTARGNVEISLTSPSGMVSRLAEVHADTGDNFSGWTFMTVRNWGEAADGVWTLKVADVSNANNSTGGTLTSAELTVFGATSAPANPAPVVQLTSPADGTTFSPGDPVTLAATATDLAIGGAAGNVSQVEFLSGNQVVGTDSSAPYSISWTPSGVGSYALRARATDSEGATGLSSTVTISVANQVPVITAAAITPAAPAFSDQALSISNLAAADPEGSVVSLTYQWQSSTDAQTFADAPGATSSILPASPDNAGKLWRCRITPSDGTQSGTAFVTESVLVVVRPPATVTTGQAFSFTANLPMRGSAATFTRQAVINEFSQGPTGGTAEWVEILTLKSGSMRNWQFLDSSTAPLTFANSSVWDNIPAGTCIVIFNGISKDAVIPANDTNPNDDGRMVIASNNTTYFSGTWPSLGNSGDSLRIRDGSSATVHQISYGNVSTFPPNIGAVGSGTAAYLAGDSEEAATLAAGWNIGSSATAGSASTSGVTPGAGNLNPNTTWVSNLRSGFFNQSPRYRFASSSQTPAGLSIDESTGAISGVVTAAAGDYPIVVERFNGTGEVASFAFILRVNPVAPPAFSSWVLGFGALSDTRKSGDPDGDGLVNLMEFLLAKNPGLRDSDAAIRFESSTTALSLTYWKSKSAAAVRERVVWSTDLVNWSADGVSYAADVDLGDRIERRASVPVSGRSRLYLRLEASE